MKRNMKKDKKPQMTQISRILLLLVMMTAGATGAWGEDHSGTYFIKSESSNKNTPGDYYICPTKNWYLYKATNSYENETDDDDDNGQPFLTTYKCKDGTYDVRKAVWTIEKHPTKTNCYYIIQSKTGRYMVSNGQIGSSAYRMRVHLESVADATALSNLGDLALFEITSHDGHIDIVPHSSDGRAGNTYKYIVVNFKNFNELIGSAGKTGGPSGTYGENTAGIIGLYDTEDNHKWSFELANPVTPAPTITHHSDGTITITGTGTIYYTTDGTNPTTSSATYSTAITVTDEISVIKAMAKDGNSYESMVVTYELPQCEKPVITISDGTVTITTPTEGASIRYTTDDTPPTSSSTLYNAPFSIDGISVIRAIAVKTGYANSKEAYYMDFKTVSSSSEITNMHGLYRLASGFTSTATIGTAAEPFMGTIDGQLNVVSNLSHPLVAYATDAIIKNVILDNVSISGGTNVGAVCGEASGDCRIFNCGVLATTSTVTTDKDGYTAITSCSSTISGSGYVGSIVGLLDGSSRVINCYSYANVSGGSFVGGIVGYNNVATTATNLKTMVMNCMFYGEVSGSSISPIYNGEIITNVGENTGVSNFNYFRLESDYIQDNSITKVYHCALGAETRFLQRFEFFRQLLNSHLELAGWWATGTYSKDEMMKWVLEPSQIGTSTPYPILKTPGKYQSVVNLVDNNNAETEKPRNKGGKLGTLSVTIRMGSSTTVYGPPSGATISTGNLTLPILDKDEDHFNFNYYKVQLPYYNDVGTKNYNGNRVVTGWKIVEINGSSTGTGTFSTGTADAPSYNFADRNSTKKDLYSLSGRVFNQGAYWDVPEGVTRITIEPYWAKAAYVADAYADVVYNTAMESAYNVPNVGGGQIYTSGSSYPIAGENQVVYTSLSNAKNQLTKNHNVYDEAIVLVGNVHNIGVSSDEGDRYYTIMSIDADHDNEPDYSYMLRFNGRTECHPVRTDFINIPGLGMAQKSTGGTGSYNFGILIPKGWFESTNTSLFRFTQFEYEHKDHPADAPLILQGGVMEQWVSNNQKGTSNNIPYIHVGGNVWFKEFHTGCHQDKQIATKHSPISVTGGDYDEFYLTGLYRGDVGNKEDNAECYINGGRFGTVCGAAMEGIGKANGADNTGNIVWQIQNADIHEFYAGGLNAAKPVTGNLSTTITDSYVDIFCGGPKFGDMSANKTVHTKATGCTFGTYFGAGYGGNSYSRYAPTNRNNVTNTDWNNWLNGQYKQEYNATYGGVSTQFDYQFLPMSDNKTNVARLFVEYVKFSLATTRSVTSTLTKCTINNNFYGGGRLGKVAGTINSTLDSCTVKGNVFGAGYSADLPSVEVDSIGFKIEPYYYDALGTYRTGVKGKTVTYTWDHKNTVNSTATAIDKNNHILYTAEELGTNLGSVAGSVTLTLKGTTKVGTLVGDVLTPGTGNVFGGGEKSYVTGAGNTVTVNIEGKTDVYGNVFGGGDNGVVEGSTKVYIK